MNKHRTLSVVMGLLGLVCFEACSRQPNAKARFQFGPPDDATAEQAVRALLPENDSSVTLVTIRHTGLYELVVSDPDPHKAARRANEIVATMQAKLNNGSSEMPFKILERAGPQLPPTT